MSFLPCNFKQALHNHGTYYYIIVSEANRAEISRRKCLSNEYWSFTFPTLHFYFSQNCRRFLHQCHCQVPISHPCPRWARTIGYPNSSGKKKQMSTCDITMDSRSHSRGLLVRLECHWEIVQIVFQELSVTSHLKVRLGAFVSFVPSATHEPGLRPNEPFHHLLSLSGTSTWCTLHGHLPCDVLCFVE